LLIGCLLQKSFLKVLNIELLRNYIIKEIGDYDRCIGCGVCAFNCPEGALTMVKKYYKMPAANAIEAMTKNVSGRTH
jgi:ferredoxin